jgi:hypothetical protein
MWNFLHRGRCIIRIFATNHYAKLCEARRISCSANTYFFINEIMFLIKWLKISFCSFIQYSLKTPLLKLSYSFHNIFHNNNSPTPQKTFPSAFFFILFTIVGGPTKERKSRHWRLNIVNHSNFSKAKFYVFFFQVENNNVPVKLENRHCASRCQKFGLKPKKLQHRGLETHKLRIWSPTR